MQFEAIAQEWFDAQILRGPKRARDQTVLNTRTSKEKYLSVTVQPLSFFVRALQALVLVIKAQAQRLVFCALYSLAAVLHNVPSSVAVAQAASESAAPVGRVSWL